MDFTWRLEIVSGCDRRIAQWRCRHGSKSSTEGIRVLHRVIPSAPWERGFHAGAARVLRSGQMARCGHRHPESTRPAISTPQPLRPGKKRTPAFVLPANQEHLVD